MCFSACLNCALILASCPWMKLPILRILLLLQALQVCAFANSAVVNLSHYDLMRPDFVTMKNEGIVGIIHEATYPSFQRDAQYVFRQQAAAQAGLLWGAYHYANGTRSEEHTSELQS